MLDKCYQVVFALGVMKVATIIKWDGYVDVAPNASPTTLEVREACLAGREESKHVQGN